MESLTRRVDDLTQEVHLLKTELVTLRSELHGVKTEQQVQKVQIANIEKKLDKIEGNTTWLLRIVIGAIILYILQSIFEKTQVASGLISFIIGG